jgi:hypothetical protein
MRATIVLVLTFFLISCESDFDKCINTELPRAETLVGLEAEREAGRQLVLMREVKQKLDVVEEEMEIWIKKNPYPSAGLPEYPARESLLPELSDYNCSDDMGHDGFMECSNSYLQEMREYTKATDELDAAHDAAVEIYNQKREEWSATPAVVAYVDSREKERLRLGRATGLPVSNSEEMDDLYEDFSMQTETLVMPRSLIFQCWYESECEGEGEYNEMFEQALAEATLTNATTISVLAEQSKELATVTCNNNGFYE